MDYNLKQTNATSLILWVHIFLYVVIKTDEYAFFSI